MGACSASSFGSSGLPVGSVGVVRELVSRSPPLPLSADSSLAGLKKRSTAELAAGVLLDDISSESAFSSGVCDIVPGAIGP